MNSIEIGPFHIAFAPDGVEFRTLHPTERNSLTYMECYTLLAELYQRRETLYRLSHEGKQQTEDRQAQALNGLTYTIDDISVSVAGWGNLADTEESSPKREEGM